MAFWSLLIALVGFFGNGMSKAPQLLLANALTLLIGVLALQMLAAIVAF